MYIFSRVGCSWLLLGGCILRTNRVQYRTVLVPVRYRILASHCQPLSGFYTIIPVLSKIIYIEFRVRSRIPSGNLVDILYH